MNNELRKTHSTELTEDIGLQFVDNIKIELLKNDQQSIVYLFFKRIFDIVLSIIGLFLLSPLLLIVCILIKIENPKSSVLFTQERIGLNGAPFKMYKFRSMVENAEELLEDLLKYNEVDGAMFKMENDPRITTVGRIIRKTSIDELPQLFNVIKGDMSLVGPRPALKREVELYDQLAMLRLQVLPGCTGLWQATVRNSVGFREMLALDLKYIENQSLVFDLKIIIMTIFSLIKMKAY